MRIFPREIEIVVKLFFGDGDGQERKSTLTSKASVIFSEFCKRMAMFVITDKIATSLRICTHVFGIDAADATIRMSETAMRQAKARRQ